MTAAIRAVAFDLDGTLIDSLPDLAAAAVELLRTLGAPPLPEAQIRGFIGDGIDRLVERTLAASLGPAVPADTAHEAALRFRALYASRIFERSRVYPRVLEALHGLRADGLALCCVTNKASALSRPLLERAGLAGCFDSLHCADEPGQRKPQPRLLLEASGALGVNVQQLLMVGDSRHDVGAARAAGCRVAAVSYGYDPAIASTHPDWLIGCLTEVRGLIGAKVA